MESVCHEVAHLLVSAPHRRGLPEFGLGPDPYRNSDARRAALQQEADAEELDACTMQLVLVRLLGLSEIAVMIEVKPEPLTRSRLRSLRRRRPDALPAEWWRRASRTVGQ
jgi:elongation factor P hydroxylase